MKTKLYKIRSFFLISVILIVNQICSMAQVSGHATITGIVMDKVSEKPVEYANAVLYNADSAIVSGDITDSRGKYEIKGVSEGHYFLTLEFIGFKKQFIQDIRISAGKRIYDLGRISIEQVAEELSAVDVVSEKKYVEYKIDKKEVNVSKNANAAGGTAADALRSVPGVTVDQDGNVALRGSSNFTVLIDGKPTVMSSSEALKQISSDAVEKMEVITNPSAKYDPDGTSGIINIIMKKGNKDGMNGIINLSASTGDKYSGDFLINFRKSRINYFFGADYRHQANPSETEMDRESWHDSTHTFLNTISDRNVISNSKLLKSGFDYSINDRNSLSFSGELGEPHYERMINSKYHEWLHPDSAHSFMQIKDDFSIKALYYILNLTHQKKFSLPGHEILTTFFFSNVDVDRIGDSREIKANSLWETFDDQSGTFHSSQNDRKQEFRFKSDYTLPLDSIRKMEAGMQITLRPITSGMIFENYDTLSQTWIQNSAFTNSFNFHRNIFALYAMYSGQWKGFQFQAGLRGEYTDRELVLIRTKERFPLQRFDLFPTFSFSRQLKTGRQLQFSYSRRINRPSEFLLNPLSNYSDKYIISLGNPALLPEYTDSYEINFMNYLKTGFVSAECYFRKINNIMDQSMKINEAGILCIQYKNLDYQLNYGITLSGNADFTKWLRVYSSFSVFFSELSGSGITYDVPDVAGVWNMYFTPTFTIKGKLKIQPFLSCNGPTYSSQGRIHSFFNGGLSARYDFLKQKATITGRISNPFGLFQYTVDFQDTEYVSDFRMKQEANVTGITFSYRINNYRPSQKRNEQIQENMNPGGLF